MTSSRSSLPTGTVTFLRTDVEGSMRLAAALGSRWDELNAAQLAVVRDAVGAHGGVTVRTEGDAVFGVFADAARAVAAAIDTQRGLIAWPWPDGTEVRVRIGLHSGEAHLAGDDYGGFDVNRAARIAAVGHGGQIVLSDPTRALVATDLPDGVAIRDLGRHVLKDVPHPERLFQLDVPGLPADFPPIRTRLSIPGNLPPRLTSFVGREAELREARRLLDGGRLLTISGPGGIGKTSLATELARAVAADYADGAWLVELDAVSDAGQVPALVARTMGVYDGAGRPVAEGVIRHLADRELLLLLDNFEHVLEVAPFVTELLRSAADLRVVVTTRAPLRISGEQEYPVGPLLRSRPRYARRASGVPGRLASRASPAVRLFIERARPFDPAGRRVRTYAIVQEVCERLDGLPLGIELAAARVALLSPAAIRDRLAARLPLPGSGPRDVPDSAANARGRHRLELRAPPRRAATAPARPGGV